MTMRKAGIATLVAGLMLGAATAATAQGHGMGQMGPGMMAPGQMAPGMMGQGMQPGMMGQGMAPGMMGQGMTPCMMGQGMGPGMMGQGMAPGMMGQGMGPGMMGQGMGPGMMGGRGPMAGLRITPIMHLTTEDVQHYLEHYLERHGFQHLRVGEVRQTDDTITADIVTQEGSLALQLEVDPHTGLVTRFS